MGFDDGECEIAPEGVHEFVSDELVVTGRGMLDEVLVCAWCGVSAYEASDDPAARPPL